MYHNKKIICDIFLKTFFSSFYVRDFLIGLFKVSMVLKCLTIQSGNCDFSRCFSGFCRCHRRWVAMYIESILLIESLRSNLNRIPFLLLMSPKGRNSLSPSQLIQIQPAFRCTRLFLTGFIAKTRNEDVADIF